MDEFGHARLPYAFLGLSDAEYQDLRYIYAVGMNEGYDLALALTKSSGPIGHRDEGGRLYHGPGGEAWT